ncbi:PPA1309 family protein [Amycolatopsis palatopharyngis]|uniref:PPA1309 family protein n=1 Tax=Amycolatopsis palatopharyngis TaxID=187982 RepID=UPI000E24D5C2|nr:PPA1309 family protein [Amycolatopsis palatopharyngis]
MPDSEQQAETNQSMNPSVAALAREVEDFVASGGWDQPPQLFALVPTADLLSQQPELAAQLDAASPLTPVAQEELPEGDLAEALGRIAWPEAVHGCALAQEIIVLPPDAEQELPGGGHGDEDAKRLRQAAADHPRRTEARLVAAVLRDGSAACVLRLRGLGEGDSVDEVVEHPELAPNLVDALKATFAP